MTRPVRLTKTFAERVAKQLNAPEPTTNRRAADSRFYDVRPARIHSGWEWDAEANVWRGKMSLAPDDYPWFDVCAPLRTQAQGAPYPRDAYVVWRGRWELLEDEIALQATPRDVLIGLGEPETVQAVEAFPNPQKGEFLTDVAVDYVEDVPTVKI